MKLDEWRKARKFTQEQLAEMIGVASRVSVARYESGRVPDQDVLRKIIEITSGEVTANDFYDIPCDIPSASGGTA